MEMDKNITIKLWYFWKVNKKQFIWIYTILFILVILATVRAFYYNPVISADASWIKTFYFKNDVTIWMMLNLYSVIEALIFWNFFYKEQIKIINKQKAELEQQKEEIKSQSEEIEAQRDDAIEQKQKIEEQQHQITASIQYAERIQLAALPPKEELDRFFDNFIFFRPRDIVSGDFYWFETVENNGEELHIITAADCTGHGVPGAFVSMLGISLLKEIVNVEKTFKAGDILNSLRSKIKSSLHQQGRPMEQQDGMDISLVVINKNKQKLDYAGANNPLYICRSANFEIPENNKKFRILSDDKSNNLLEIKPNKMPIGIYTFEKDFTSQEFSYQKNDTIYMFSDGYIDQFGGDEGHKFMSKNFKKLLLKVSQKPISEQVNFLNTTITNWIGNREQIDDILVMGIRL